MQFVAKKNKKGLCFMFSEIMFEIKMLCVFDLLAFPELL